MSEFYMTKPLIDAFLNTHNGDPDPLPMLSAMESVLLILFHPGSSAAVALFLIVLIQVCDTPLYFYSRSSFYVLFQSSLVPPFEMAICNDTGDCKLIFQGF